MYYEVIPTKIYQKSPTLSSGILLYHSDITLKPGHVVLVPLGKNLTPGIIYRRITLSDNPSYKIKKVEQLLNTIPLPPHILKSIFWLNSYYLSPLPANANLVLPSGVTKKRRSGNRSSLSPKMISSTNSSSLNSQAIALSSQITLAKFLPPLNSHQKNALLKLRELSIHTKLLHGITGSGKTNIYIHLAFEQFKKSLSTILLVPEISLTPQLVQRFQSIFHDSVITIHSKQTEATRHLIWQTLLTSDKPYIIIGPRSAIFSPLHNLGLIIIDEAHEQTYYQENSPKYSSLRLASFIANTKNISCIYGTATPLITDYYLAQKKHACIKLFQKAKATAISPDLSLIDLKDKTSFTRNKYFSNQLITKITQNLKSHHQTLIFHNRRGSASLTLCDHCGWQSLCPSCLLPLTMHSDTYQLICHTCGYSESIPKICPICQHPDIIHKGFGTKLLESELKKIFKTAHIIRFDADTISNNSFTQLYQSIKTGQIDILIGTQAIAKGFDFPHLETVGIIQADSGLNFPDYSAEERTFHLLTQVIGRVGRGHLNSASAYIQTYQPDHPVIRFALQNDYQGFYQYLLSKRQLSHFPPFFYLAKLYVTQKTEATTVRKIRKLYQTLKIYQNNFSVSQPTPAFHELSSSGFTWQLVVKSTSRKQLCNIILEASKTLTFHFSIDPPTII